MHKIGLKCVSVLKCPNMLLKIALKSNFYTVLRVGGPK